jgi:leucyl aminopeptidase
MCEPTTPLIASAAVSTLGTVVGGVNAMNAAKARAEVEQRNMQLERAASRDALERGAEEERRQYRRNAQRMGAIRAAQAASGLETEFGTNADVQDDAKLIGWQDAMTVRQNAMREARGFEIRAWNAETRSNQAKAEGKAAMVGAIFDAGSNLLSYAQQYRKMRADGGGNNGGGHNLSGGSSYKYFGG